MSETGNNPELTHQGAAQYENGEKSYIHLLSTAIKNKDRKVLKETLTKLKDTIESVSDVKAAPITDAEIEKLLSTGSATIYLGTGSTGDRIIFSDGKMYMSSYENDSYGKMRRDVFRAIFGLPHVENEIEDPSIDLYK